MTKATDKAIRETFSLDRQSTRRSAQALDGIFVRGYETCASSLAASSRSVHPDAGRNLCCVGTSVFKAFGVLVTSQKHNFLCIRETQLKLETPRQNLVWIINHGICAKQPDKLQRRSPWLWVYQQSHQSLASKGDMPGTSPCPP